MCSSENIASLIPQKIVPWLNVNSSIAFSTIIVKY